MGWNISRNTKKIVQFLMLREYGVKNEIPPAFNLNFNFLTSVLNVLCRILRNKKEKVPTGTTTKHPGHMNTCFL